MNELEQLQQDNEALRLALQAQQEINHYKQFFLARIAHELRSPLSSLISLQQLILHDFCETPAEEKEFLTDANAAAKKLLTMIDDLVTVAKIDYGKISLDYCPIVVTDLLAELKYSLKLPVGNCNFKLDCHAPDSLPLINGDRQKILWILRNLIDRSLQISPDKHGTIKLEGMIKFDDPAICLKLHLPCAPAVWQFSPTEGESTDILASTHLQKISYKFLLSPAVTWQLAQTMAGKMNGSLVILPQSSPENKPQQTVMVLQLPMVDSCPQH